MIFSFISIFLNVFSWTWYIFKQFKNNKTSPSIWLATFISMGGDFFVTWDFSNFLKSLSFGISFFFCGILLTVYFKKDKINEWRFDLLTSTTIIFSIISLFFLYSNPIVTLINSIFFALLSTINFLKDMINQKSKEPFDIWFLSFLINLFMLLGIVGGNKLALILPTINLIGCLLISLVSLILAKTHKY